MKFEGFLFSIKGQDLKQIMFEDLNNIWNQWLWAESKCGIALNKGKITH